jgi:hypothetical protein
MSVARTIATQIAASVGGVNGAHSILNFRNIAFRLTQISLIFYASRPTEGRLAIVTDAGRDAMAAGGASDEGVRRRTAKSCGPDAPTLASSWRSDPPARVTNKPGRPGEYEGNR